MTNNHWKPQNGYIQACMYCGEQIGNSKKYCAICKTKIGRQSIFNENVKIFKENAKLGYKIPTELKNPI